ncbi:AAA family ATPase [Acidithiobacillus sulfurivorans]|uniref:AAA family ATPase n=1 Tax=Acidithiobacillus sulfurivorans TaxID=1958756 RepID=A0ABS6A0Y5_9PROT|nr:AAA family ATPase [Acidithiobacillus sulfurivorans]MBU2761156.1 AAA family ATPase [Acidithiobacillus sulfurivorans]
MTPLTPLPPIAGDDTHSLLPPGEIVWRGVLQKVLYHQPAGVLQKDGRMGSGWGIFILNTVFEKEGSLSDASEAAVIGRKIMASKRTWTVKGALVGDPQVGMEILCHGKCIEDAKYGRQFEARVMVEPLPDVRDMDHILRWLTLKTGQSRHRIMGMTKKRAQKAVEHFGAEILNALADPLRLQEIFPEKVCGPMAESFLRESRSYRLHLFFLDHGLNQGHVHSVLAHLEEQYLEEGEAWTVDSVVARTQEDPYWLTGVSGIGFQVADKVARSLGIAEDDPARLRAGLRHALDLREKDGHTATKEEDLLVLASGKDVLRVDSMAHPVQALQSLQDVLSQWVVDRDKGIKGMEGILCWDIPRDPLLPSDEGKMVQKWIARAACGYSERYVARRILEMSQVREGASMLPKEALQAAFSQYAGNSATSVVLSGSQRAAVLQACSARFGVLTGGPGTGKTTCLDTVARAALACHLRVELCAPSGKAASRLKQATGLPGKTIHRLLKMGPDGGATFDQKNPYPADLFIVDESSMVDVYLMQHLLRAIPDTAGVLLVGDDQQLPSVGPGRIFGDIIRSGVVPVGRLTENRRQGGASDIATGASRVISGRLPCALPVDRGCPMTPVYGEGGVQETFFSTQWVDRQRPADADEGDEEDALFSLHSDRVQSAVEQDIRHLLDRGVSVEDIQILTPQKNGTLGVVSLNPKMTTLLNPMRDQDRLLWPEFLRPLEMGVWEDQPIVWEIGHRVIQVKNDYANDVFNGDMGVVVWTEPEGVDQAPMLGVYFEQGDLPKLSVFMEEARRYHKEKPLSDWQIADMQAFSSYLSGKDAGKVVWYPSSGVSRVRPAGVLTIHKTQGSEYPYVIMILHGQHWFMASRPLLYTGMTRAKKGLRLYLSEKSGRKAAQNVGAGRDTLLAYRLNHAWLDV